MFRKLILSSVLLAGFAGVAMAENGDANIDALVAQQPHSEAVTEGTPTIVDNQDGEPVIRYEGHARGNLSSGVPVIVDNQDGEPVIQYRKPASMTAMDHEPGA